MEASSIPAKFPIPWGENQTSTYLLPVPETTANPNLPSLELGFPASNFVPEASGGTPPDGRYFNGIFQQITQWCQWLSAGGPINYDSVFSAAIGGYPNGAWLLSASGDSWWVSQVDNNTSDPDTGGANWLPLSFGQVGTGNPNGNVAGTAPVQGSLVGSLYYDIGSPSTGLWVCTTSGTATSAVWTQIGGSGGGGFYCGTSTGTANAQVLATPAAMTTFPAGTMISCKAGAGLTNTGATTYVVGSFGTFGVRKESVSGPAALAGGEIHAANTPVFLFDGTYLHLLNPALGTASQANASSGTGTVAAVSGSTTSGNLSVFADSAGTIEEGPALSSSSGIVATVNGSVTAGHYAKFADGVGTIEDGGPPGAAGQNYPLTGSTTIGTGPYDIDSSGGSFTVTSAATPSALDNFSLRDVGFVVSANPVTWNPNGNTINGNTGNFTFDLNGAVLFASFKSGNWTARITKQ